MIPDYDAILRPMVETFAKEQHRPEAEIRAELRDALDRMGRRDIARRDARRRMS